MATRAKKRPKVEAVSTNGRDRLISAAIRLFGRHGYEAVSVRAIAKEAEVSWALIRFYFGSKEGLREAAEDRVAKAYLTASHQLRIAETMDEVTRHFDDLSRSTELSDIIRYLPHAILENRPFALDILRAFMRQMDETAAVQLSERFPEEDFLRDPIYAVVPVMGHYLLAPQIKTLLGRDVFSLEELKRRNLQIQRIWQLVTLGLEAEQKSLERVDAA